jgi:hydrogenase nickel incorporation protein HypA/HybF
MHELSIAESLVEQLTDLARREGAARVARVELRIGALSGVDPEALAFAFPVAADGTIAEGAELAARLVPARATCRACGAETESDSCFAVCARCASPDLTFQGGRDLTLYAVTFAEAGAPPPGATAALAPPGAPAP